MRVRDLSARAIGSVEGWIFGPGSARRLAAVRIGLCLVLGARLSRPLYEQLAGQPAALYQPISFMHLFPSMPSLGVVLFVQVLSVAACLLGAAGLLTRVTLPAAWLGGLFLNGLWSSVGQPMHNETLLLLAFTPLLIAPPAEAWSLSARRDRPAHVDPSVRYGWSVRTAMIVVAGGYFFSGLNKLVFSGPGWFLSDNLRWVMYRISDENRHPIGSALFIAAHPLLAHATAVLTLVTELGFPLSLWKPRTAWFFVPATVLLHVGIGLTMHLDYSAWALTVIVVFVPWDALAERVLTRHPRRRPGTLFDRVPPAPRSA